MLFRTKYRYKITTKQHENTRAFHMQSNCSEQDIVVVFFVACVEVFTPINCHAQTYIVLTYSHASRWITLGPTFNFFSFFFFFKGSKLCTYFT